VGTAACRFLAADGHSVAGFEQFQLDHDRGSSYGGSRIIRKVYPDALYASLMEAAYPLWDDLESESGDALFLRCGGFFFGPAGHPDMAATEQALQQVGVPYEALSAADARRRLPPFRLNADEYGIYEPQSGLLRASACVLANARGARARGAELREGVCVERMEPASTGVRLTVNGVTELFDRVVVSAGPWTETLLSPWLQLPLNVTRQQYAHFAVPGDRSAFAADRFPVWIDMESHFYGFPEHDEIPGVKVALHRPGPTIDPSSPDREPHDAVDDILREYMARRLPEVSGEVTHHKVCLYTNTPDEDFIIDTLPGEPRVVFVGGLSGHGFKFTVLLGRIAARLASGADPGHDLTRFRLSRFNTE
jgi:monomeric sarcosine oxidase